MRSIFAAALLALAFSAGPQLAQASTETLTISGNTSQGAFTATVVLTVSGGYATSGTGTISGAGFGGPEALTLITLATPGGNYGGTVGWRSNGGDDFYGFDDAFPVTQSGGLLFVAEPAFTAGGQPVWRTGLDFGFWNNGPVGPGSDYQAGFYGYTDSGYRFYEQTGSITVGVPEPSAWALMLLGFAGLGFAGYRRNRAVNVVA